METILNLADEISEISYSFKSLTNNIEKSKNRAFMKDIEGDIEEFPKSFKVECSNTLTEKRNFDDLRKKANDFYYKKRKEIEEIEEFNVENHKELFLEIFLKYKKEKEFVKPILTEEEKKFMSNPESLNLNLDDDGYKNGEQLWFKKIFLFIAGLMHGNFKSEKFIKKYYNDGRFCYNIISSPSLVDPISNFARLLKMLEYYNIKSYIVVPNYRHPIFCYYSRCQLSYGEYLIVSEAEFFFDFPEMLKYKKILIPIVLSQKNEFLAFNIYNVKQKYSKKDNNSYLAGYSQLQTEQTYFLLKEIDKILLERNLNN